MKSDQIIIYQTEDGKVKIETHFENESVWLSIEQIAEFFQKSRSTINEHILNIYKEQELTKEISMRKIGISGFSTKPTNFYSLDVIISVGYRVKSHRGVHFRRWATALIKEYLIKVKVKNRITQVEKDFIEQIEDKTKMFKGLKDAN